MQRRRAVGTTRIDARALVEQASGCDAIASLRRVAQSVVHAGGGRFNRHQSSQTHQT